MTKYMPALPGPAGPRTAGDSARARLGGVRPTHGVLLVALLLAVAVGLLQVSPPAVAPLTAPDTTYSATRAMQHLAQIAREPHPIGSSANARVRDYLVTQLRALGLDPQVQMATAVQERLGVQVGTVENVVVRLLGTEPGPAILLAAHHGSVPTSPSASDDGAAGCRDARNRAHCAPARRSSTT